MTPGANPAMVLRVAARVLAWSEARHCPMPPDAARWQPSIARVLARPQVRRVLRGWLLPLGCRLGGIRLRHALRPAPPPPTPVVLPVWLDRDGMFGHDDVDKLLEARFTPGLEPLLVVPDACAARPAALVRFAEKLDCNLDCSRAPPRLRVQYLAAFFGSEAFSRALHPYHETLDAAARAEVAQVFGGAHVFEQYLATIRACLSEAVRCELGAGAAYMCPAGGEHGT